MMTDNEIRAHDLAVMYTHFVLSRELAEDEVSFANEDSAFATYESAYRSFLDNLDVLD